jgi:hypothetical protein
VSPESGTLTSGDSISLDPQTLNDGILVDGDYRYELTQPSPIDSSVSDDGQFTAGINTSSSNIEETVQITDTANENTRAFVVLIVEGRKPSSGTCELFVSPSSVTVSPGKSQKFTVHNSEECKEGAYEWKINSKIGSSISEQGLYKAATNTNSTPALDIIIVTDTVNKVSTDVIITVPTSTKAIADVSKVSSDPPNPEPAGLAGRKISPQILIFFSILTIGVGIIVIRKIRN